MKQGCHGRHSRRNRYWGGSSLLRSAAALTKRRRTTLRSDEQCLREVGADRVIPHWHRTNDKLHVENKKTWMCCGARQVLAAQAIRAMRRDFDRPQRPQVRQTNWKLCHGQHSVARFLECVWSANVEKTTSLELDRQNCMFEDSAVCKHMKT